MKAPRRLAIFAIAGLIQSIFFGIVFTRVFHDPVPYFVPYVAGVTGIIISVPMLAYFELLLARLREATTNLAIRNQELAVAKAKAVEASRAKSAFLAAMSHELRTPLNAIIGFSDILVTQNRGVVSVREIDSTGYAEHILSSGQVLLSLVNDILDLAKIEAGHANFNPVPLDLTDIVKDAVGATKPMAGERQQTINLLLPEKQRLLTADPRAAVQIAMNLISNAIKYSPVGSRIDVEIVYRADSTALHVNDQGPGMTEEEIKFAVQPYARLENNTTRESKGTGLGLPIVNVLIELHGGTLTFVACEGTGTRATATFPNLGSVRTDNLCAA